MASNNDQRYLALVFRKELRSGTRMGENDDNAGISSAGCLHGSSSSRLDERECVRFLFALEFAKVRCIKIKLILGFNAGARHNGHSFLWEFAAGL